MSVINSHHVNNSGAYEKVLASPCSMYRREAYFTDQALSRAAERLVETVGICRWQHILMGMTEFRDGKPMTHPLDDIADTDLAFLLGVHLIERYRGGFRLRVSIDPARGNGRLVNWREATERHLNGAA